MTHFVLVHGAFHGAWCWDKVAAALQQAGHSVSAPDLPGAGEDGTPLEQVDLDRATERVVGALRAGPEPAVLVGHSMGGVVVTQAAARVPDRVSRLVYLTAFRPSDGESLLELTGLPEGAGDGVQANITVDGEPPIATFDLAQARSVFYNGVAEEEAAAAVERLDRQPLAVFATPVSLEGAELPPADYVVCTQDHAIPPALQRLMAGRSPARVSELDAGHSPFLSHVDAVVGILERSTKQS
ncbi:alpha/beta fold hydrolase [Citricoccus nitrophenolicus]